MGSRCLWNLWLKRQVDFLLTQHLIKRHCQKRGIGQAFHKDRSTVWLDKEFTLSTRKTSKNNHSKVDITIFFSKIIVKLLIVVNLHRLHTVCCEVKLLQKTALNKHIFQKHLLLSASVFENWTKNKAPFFKKMQSVKTFSFISLPTKKRRRIHYLRLCLSTT